MAPTTAIARNADAYYGALELPGNAEASQAFREMLQARRFVPALEKVGSPAQLPAHITPKVRIPSDNPFTNVPDSIPTPDPGPPPPPGSPLAEAELLAANWDSWGMGSGVNFADRPSSLPQEAKDCLNFFASNPTLLAAIVQDAGGKPGDPMTLADLNQYISDAKGDDELANSLAPPGTPDNPVVSVIKQVVANWHSWGIHQGMMFDNPPSDLSPNALYCLSFVSSHPAVMKAMGDHSGSGGLTETDFANFLKSAAQDAKKGADAYSTWAAAHPDAGPESQALAQSAATLLSNLTLITAGSGNLTPSELASFAASNPTLDPSLVGAAKLWSQPGMFKMLDVSGDDLSVSTPDGIADAKNISAWITNGAPTNDLDFTNLLNQAAVENTVAGIDTSTLGPDLFLNPQNYTDAQKAAVLVQLGDLQAKLTAGGDQSYWTPGESLLAENTAGLNPNLKKVQSDVQAHIDQLSKDPQVLAYFAQKKPGALQDIVNSDPALHGAVQDFYDGKFQNGGALTDDLALKDGSGKQVSTNVGFELFMQQANFYDEALGSGGKTLGFMDPQIGANGQSGPSVLQQIVENSGQEQLLQQAFLDQIVNGGLLRNEIANGVDLATAVNEYATAAAAYGTGLDPTFLQAHQDELRNNFLGEVTDAIFDSATPTDLATAFGDQSGNFDPNKLNGILQQLQNQAPDLFKTSDGQVLTPDKIVNVFKQVFDLTRNGLKLGDALSKAFEGFSRPSGGIADAYRAGMMHIVSAVFGGGVLAAKAAAGAHNPLADVSIAATATQMVGTLTEGVAKWGGSASASKLWGNNGVPASIKPTIKGIENGAKVFGGVGNALGGALSIVAGVGDLKKGDVAGAAFSFATGATSTASGVGSAIEGGAMLLVQSGLIDSAEGLFTIVPAALGLAGTVVGVVGALGYTVYQIVKSATAANHFTDQVIPVLKQYGITGGPIESSDIPTSSPAIDPTHHKV